MITKYRIVVDLIFTDVTKRDSVYNKIKIALANAKTTDSWETGNISKVESQLPDSASEVV